MRHEAIRKAYPNVVTITIDNTETVALDKDDKVVSLDENKILEETKKLQAEYDANQYQRDRAVAYDPISEQLDQIYHDMDGWKAKIKAVKDKYPKP
tara:strand:+ start:621 stop:908 length:288 start_codon:yes stop_codon:yes gene_type:complete